MAAPSLSFHLKELTHAGLVTQERNGRYLIYRALFEHMNALLSYLTANCCHGIERREKHRRRANADGVPS